VTDGTHTLRDALFQGVQACVCVCMTRVARTQLTCTFPKVALLVRKDASIDAGSSCKLGPTFIERLYMRIQGTKCFKSSGHAGNACKKAVSQLKSTKPRTPLCTNISQSFAPAYQTLTLSSGALWLLLDGCQHGGDCGCPQRGDSTTDDRREDPSGGEAVLDVAGLLSSEVVFVSKIQK